MGRKRKFGGGVTYNTVLARLRRSKETPEQREWRLTKSRIKAAERRAAETLENRAIRLAEARASVNSRRKYLKRKLKSADVSQILESIKLANIMPSEVRSFVNKLDRKQKDAYDAYIKLKAAREANAKRGAERWRNETPEQRAYRLQKARVRAALKRENESQAERADRLARVRIQIKKQRDLKKLQNAEDNQSRVDAHLIAVTQRLDNISTRKKTTPTFNETAVIPEHVKLKPAHVAQLYHFYRDYQPHLERGLYVGQQKYKTKMLTQSFTRAQYLPGDTADHLTIEATSVECDVFTEDGNNTYDKVPLIKEEIPVTSTCDQLEEGSNPYDVVPLIKEEIPETSVFYEQFEEENNPYDVVPLIKKEIPETPASCDQFEEGNNPYNILPHIKEEIQETSFLCDQLEDGNNAYDVIPRIKEEIPATSVL